MKGSNPAQRVLTRQQVRAVDEFAINSWGIPGVILMENAGRGVADVLCKLGIRGRVVIVCGKGNNGGDGFVLARHLKLRGHEPRIILCCEPGQLSGDAACNYEWLQRCDVPELSIANATDEELATAFASAAWLVDALLGTGATGNPRPPLDDVIRLMNASTARRLAIDIPSGLDCDTGAAGDPTFRADHTCTFVARKPCMQVASAGDYLGEIHCLDIGLPWNLVERAIDESEAT